MEVVGLIGGFPADVDLCAGTGERRRDQLLAFRSLTIAAVSILLNLLSVGAAYGLLTLVFIHGAGAGGSSCSSRRWASASR